MPPIRPWRSTRNRPSRTVPRMFAICCSACTARSAPRRAAPGKVQHQSEQGGRERRTADQVRAQLLAVRGDRLAQQGRYVRQLLGELPGALRLVAQQRIDQSVSAAVPWAE